MIRPAGRPRASSAWTVKRIITSGPQTNAVAATVKLPAGTFGDVDEEDEVGADVSFEVTGVQGPLADVGDATRMAGTVVIVGYHQGGTREIPLGNWNWKALRVVNAHFREVAAIMRGMRTGMRLLTSGRRRAARRRFRLEALTAPDARFDRKFRFSSRSR